MRQIPLILWWGAAAVLLSLAAVLHKREERRIRSLYRVSPELLGRLRAEEGK